MRTHTLTCPRGMFTGQINPPGKYGKNIDGKASKVLKTLPGTGSSSNECVRDLDVSEAECFAGDT